MDPARPVILQTPLEIFYATQEHFCSAEANIEVGKNQSVTFNLRLSPYLPVLSLIHAIDSNVFLQTITQMKRRLEFDKICGQHGSYQLDINRFSVMKPLADWQKFRRVMHEAKGFLCEDAILDYLQNPQKDQQVFALGLAPIQLELAVKEADFQYFRKLKDKLLTLNQVEKQAIFAIFQTQYPNISRQILDEQLTQDQERRKSNPDKFFQDTLNTLKNGVIGQSQAVEKMAVILSSQKNLQTNKVFLFLGPTGVGKTELAKAVSRIKENRFVMFAMNQYQNETDVSKLFGSASGYVGSTDKPHFAKEIDCYRSASPRTIEYKQFYEVSNLVLLFDEFEKAHSKVKQSLLTLFDEGYCVVNYTEDRANLAVQYDFKRCVIVNTSNLYQQFILNTFQMNREYDEIQELFKQLNVSKPQPDSYSPELLGRMSIVPFGPIPRGESYQKLIKMKLTDFFSELKKEFFCKEVEIENDLLFLSALENKLYGNGTDIRKFKEFFDSIKAVIYKNYKQLEPFETKKLLFSCTIEGPCIKFLTFMEDWGIYHESKNLIRLQLP